jgi:excisionase family DNA binding protein
MHSFSNQSENGLTDQNELITRIAREMGRTIAEEISKTLLRNSNEKQLTQYLSPSQAAEILNVAEKTIRALIRNGELKSYRVGRLLRIRSDDLEQYVSGEKAASHSEINRICDDVLSGGIGRKKALKP